MMLAISIAFAITGTFVVGFSLYKIFASINPASVSGYKACKGGWWEAELNDCAIGLTKVPQQPVNTYTNLAYATGGFYLIFFLNSLPAYTFSLALLYLCVGSALYHATSTRWGGSLDASAMYAVFSALTIYAASSLTNWSDLLVALIMFLVAALMGYFLRYRFRGNMSLKIGIFIVLTYLCAFFKNGNSFNNDFLIWSFVLFVLGYLAWNLDKWRAFPFKHWGHGLWHLLTAVAIAMLFYGIYSL